MHEAAWRGSVGSSAILFRVLKQRPFFNVMDTRYLTPFWQAEAPDTLERVAEKYRVRGEKLREVGYDINDEIVGTVLVPAHLGRRCGNVVHPVKVRRTGRERQRAAAEG
jgi:hypothetical protein